MAIAGVIGKLRHLNGTAAAAAANVDVTDDQDTTKVKYARFMTIQNLDATNNLLISFDNGKNFATVAKGAVREFVGTFKSFMVKSSAATVAWEAVATISE